MDVEPVEGDPDPEAAPSPLNDEEAMPDDQPAEPKSGFLDGYVPI